MASLVPVAFFFLMVSVWATAIPFGWPPTCNTAPWTKLSVLVSEESPELVKIVYVVVILHSGSVKLDILLDLLPVKKILITFSFLLLDMVIDSPDRHFRKRELFGTQPTAMVDCLFNCNNVHQSKTTSKWDKAFSRFKVFPFVVLAHKYI